MDQSCGLSSVALVVDGYSTGEFYPAALRAKGLRPVHVASGSERGAPGLAAYAAGLLERLRPEYEAMFQDWGDLDGAHGLAARLAALAPCCVMAGCEMGVEMAELLAGRLGLPGNDPATSAIRRDKLAMHDTLAAAGLPSLASLATDDIGAALAFAEGLGSWPVVLKPLRSAATEGVSFCRTPAELRAAFSALLGSFSQFGERNASVLLQQCAQGREFAVNTVSRQGRHVLTDLWEYHKIPTPGGAPLYDRTQLVRSLGPEHHALLDYAFQVLDALGVRVGPAHTEIMLTPGGPVLIECGARPMGGSFPQDLLRRSLGHTQIQWAVDGYVDAAAFARHAAEAYRPTSSLCMKTLISTHEGELQAIPGISLAARLPSVRCGNFSGALAHWRVGRTVDLLTSSGYVFLAHEDEAVVQADWAVLRELELEAQNALFELRPADETLVTDGRWLPHAPDGYWLEPEADAAAGAERIRRALALAPGRRLLHWPCGDGRASLPLAAQGVLVTGVDSQPRFIAAAQERFRAAGLAAELRLGDACALADRDAFDAIVCSGAAFGNSGVEEDFEALVALARALRPGGRLCIEAPSRTRAERGDWDAASERMVLHFPPAAPAQGGTALRIGVRVYSVAQYRLLLQLAGLRLEQVCGQEPTALEAGPQRLLLVALKPGAAECAPKATR